MNKAKNFEAKLGNLESDLRWYCMEVFKLMKSPVEKEDCWDVLYRWSFQNKGGHTVQVLQSLKHRLDAMRRDLGEGDAEYLERIGENKFEEKLAPFQQQMFMVGEWLSGSEDDDLFE